MPSPSSVLPLLAFLGLAQAHGVILNAQGLSDSPASVGFQVEPELARNCTSISPCQQDTTIIRDAEIADNIVNECGRTELSGNIDIGENTENALAAGAVTQVQSGTQMTVTIHQVNADGAGPYTCDLVEAGNNGIITQNLTVEDNVPGANGFSQAKEQAFDIKVTMPDDFTCTGSSAGNVCTVRCRNNALAGPFGGCFPVQQVDTEASVNTASKITTAATLEKVQAQVQQDIQDLPAAIEANNNAGSDEQLSAKAVVSSLLQQSIVSSEAPTQTVDVVTGVQTSAEATATDDANDANSSNNNSNNNKNSNNRGNNNKNNNNNRRRRSSRPYLY
ncbi:hypothetical protein F4778DRAFT_327867 [Xylariomycetidae sp. FL2044]|nr:hypothetical protein F4778DRAFT_327867 [Xylariomycetidae sp. FL2044]